MHRPIPGLFEVLLDDDLVVEIMERAAQSKGKQSRRGPLVVRFSPIPKVQADYIVAHPESVPLLHKATALPEAADAR